MKNTTKRLKSKKGPFRVLRDGGRYYIMVPTKLQSLLGRAKYTSTNKKSLELTAEMLNAQYGEHAATLTSPESILDLFDRLCMAGYPGESLQQLLREQIQLWKKRSSEPTLGELHQLYIDDCRKRGKNSMIINLSRLTLPWPESKISEFDDQLPAKAFIQQIEEFLDAQFDIHHGTPSSKGTRNRWLCDFLAIINFAVKKRLTPVRTNPLAGAFDLTKYSLGFHSLRRSFNSELANSGVSQEIRQKLIGHASADVNDIYTELETETLRKAVHRLPVILEPKRRASKTDKSP